MQRLKILHIIKSLGRGGAEMLLPETLKLHDPTSFEFHYIYFLPWKNQMVPAIEQAGGKVTCFSASNNIELLRKYNSVLRYCEEHQIDLVHCHLPWSGFLGRLVHKISDIPVLYTEHNIQERYHLATKTLNKLTFNSQTAALGVSRDVTRSIKENIHPKIPVNTLLNGVNTSRFKKDIDQGRIIRSKYQIPLDSIVVGNIAVFRKQKGLTDWVKAFKEITEKRKDVYGILVGAGPLEAEVKQQIKELGLSNNLKLAGLQTDTVSYFSAMDIFMMSSEFEGLPIALLEAMSMSCAVVSTKAGGVVEVIREPSDGLLSEVGDWSSLARQVLQLIKEPARREELQISARQRVVSDFSLNNMVDELEKVYQRVAIPSVVREKVNS
ncbi:MAG: glycosyltransferase [Christiangramia sp.]|nr:glycosyltransferase [Christiangramia sp.]